MLVHGVQRQTVVFVVALLAALGLMSGVAGPGVATVRATSAVPPGHGFGSSYRSGVDAGACRRRAGPLRVGISARRWPRVADHLRDVHRSGRWPRVWHIDRRGADRNREQAIDHWEETNGGRFSEAERRGKDRDEAPPAIAREGGLWRGRFADVRLVSSSENRSAGAFLGNRLEGWCNGQRFVLVGR